ncbi:MAG: hemerythrin domain-containing protein [Dysgonamonadaceae bacterium]|jgi:regulator of cell morphogenesis and NO signaling|nr:hemerythrin domain-containing protein [Dysgonamonadaceae bacterium]
MNNGLFSEKMKMADLVLTNYRLLYVFPCFGLGLGLGESTVKQVCEKNGISVSLFLLVCNLYAFDDYCPDTDSLAQIPLDDLMKYLKSSHKDYLENRMSEVIAQILNLVDCCRVKHGELLMGFCEKYRQEVVAHFDYEEQVVFPYIRGLLGGEKAGYYKIKEYERNHGNLEAALNDLKNIIIKYLPPECTIEKSRSVLIQLFLFESDLAKHTLLEERILIALVERIENNLS